MDIAREPLAGLLSIWSDAGHLTTPDHLPEDQIVECEQERT